MGSVGESPHLPQSQLSSSLGLRLSGEATVSDMSLVCTDMEPPLPLPLPPTSPPVPHRHQAENIIPPWGNLPGSLPGGGREQPLIVGEAGDGEEEGIWKGLPWAEGGAFSSGAVEVEYYISFQVSSMVVMHSSNIRGDP